MKKKMCVMQAQYLFSVILGSFLFAMGILKATMDTHCTFLLSVSSYIYSARRIFVLIGYDPSDRICYEKFLSFGREESLKIVLQIQSMEGISQHCVFWLLSSKCD